MLLNYVSIGESPFFFPLSAFDVPGTYEMKVRPNGVDCARRIRRQIEITI